MTSIQVPVWIPAVCDGPNSARAVVDAIRYEREAAYRLRQAEAEARALIAQAEENERRAQAEIDAAAWRAWTGRADSGCYYGCGCDD